VALSSGLDEADSEDGVVSMMTVHSAKGLEFPVVFVVGMEQDVFPHLRCRDDMDAMAEERRLAYVAYTRARDVLYLTLASRRFLSGRPQINPPSPFVLDLPDSLVTYQRIQAEGGYGRTQPRKTVGYASGNYPPLRLVTPATQQPSTDPFDQRPPEEFGAASAGVVGRSDSLPVASDNNTGSTNSSSGYRVGMTVTHSRFGSGQVKWISGKSPKANLTIFFPEIGRSKTIREDFINPL